MDDHVRGQRKCVLHRRRRSTVTGIRELHPTANIPGTIQHMTAHAVNHTTGEVIDAAVDDAPVPACGG
jgi:hypothetical protein